MRRRVGIIVADRVGYRGVSRGIEGIETVSIVGQGDTVEGIVE